MQYGVKDIVDVVLKDITTGLPVAYLESLKTTGIETKAGSETALRGGSNNIY